MAIEQDDQQEFDQAFGIAAGVSDPPPPPEDAPEKSDPEPKETPPEPTPAAEAPPKTETPPAADPPKDEAAHLKGRVGWLEGTLRLEQEKARKLQEELEAARKATPVQDPGATDDEAEAIIKELEDELPTVGKAMRALLNKATAARPASTDEIDRVVRERVAPIEETYRKAEADRHFSTIRAAHPDFDQITAKDSELFSWVEKQPSYLRAGMTSVLNEGNAADVVDLLTRFKQETNRPTTTARGAAPNRAKEIAAASAVARRSPATVPQSAPDPDDYDAAFEEAVRAGSK
jgi:hypothetical protein